MLADMLEEVDTGKRRRWNEKTFGEDFGRRL